MILNSSSRLLLLAFSLAACQPQGHKTIEPAADMKLKPYPHTKKVDTVDHYFGTAVPDPYRWLENDTSAETNAWVQAENEVTQNYLSQIPFRDAIKKRLETLWNYEKVSAPVKESPYTYYSKNDGLQNQAIIYREQEGGKPELFLDPNQFSDDGTTSLSGMDFSKDGSLLAFQISEGGSDWRKVIVWKTADKSVVGDTLIDIKFSGLAWRGNEGFYYSSYDKPKEGSALSGLTQHHKLYFHQLGTSQSSDRLVFGGEANPKRYIGAYLTEDERLLVITAANATSGNELYIQDLSKPDSKIVPVVSNQEKEHSIIAHENGRLLIYTNLNAPNYRVVETRVDQPDPNNWKDLIPETENVLSVATGGGKLFAQYLKDATSLVKQFNLQGQEERTLELPGVGSASGFDAKQEEKEVFYTFSSYIYPPTVFQYDIASGTSTEYKKPAVQFNPEDFESKQVFYASKDGTKVPMIITYKKGMKLDGNNPTLLYAYGGFNISLTPSFNISTILFLEQGGIYAVPNLRGGGEYGEKWHLAGTKLQKQNVFDDFIAAAEYLIQEKYTSKEKLAISGASNGGLLIGATMTQRPDLFKVAFPAVGVMDMLRYHKFTAGAGWAYDYGTSEDSREMFEYLYKYSPYHALREGVQYPATLVTTADHDDRVVPAHSFKFAARLQAYHQGSNPVLISIETKAGHGAGKPTAMMIQEQSDKWAFLFQNVGAPYRE